MKKLYFPLIFLCAVAIVSAQAPQAKKDIFSTKEELAESVKQVPCKVEERMEGVRKLFLAAGAKEDDIKIEKFDKDKTSNVVLRKAGKTAETIVVGAHYDRGDKGCGVTDNWTGVSIIAHIYRSMRALDTQKSYVFAAFDREEVGLKGSAAMAKAIPSEERKNYCSMVNFDSFGQAYPMALTNASSGKMVKFAEKLAKESELKFTSVEIAGASTDSYSFREKDIPAIALGGLGADWQKILHTPDDQIDKVNMDSVYLGYRFGLVYIAKLDALGCQEFR
jgi:Iap family predicted aminopeptidase